MTQEEQKLRQEYYSGVRRTKYWLRYMPRRANINRYPVLKWFADSARKRDYLWSFRAPDVAPAFYVGWILTLLPLMGFQMILGVFLALIFRVNLMIVIGLQWLSNPLTAAPIWVVNYMVGNAVIRAFQDTPVPDIDAEGLIGEAGGNGMSLMEMLDLMMEAVKGGNMAEGVLHIFISICLGAVIIGMLLGFLSTLAYRFFGKRHSKRLQKLRELSQSREQQSHVSELDSTPHS